MPIDGLIRFLNAIAYDCDNTDGWQDAAPDIREAAETIIRLRDVLNEASDLLGGVDDAAKLRGKILSLIAPGATKMEEKWNDRH